MPSLSEAEIEKMNSDHCIIRVRSNVCRSDPLNLFSPSATVPRRKVHRTASGTGGAPQLRKNFPRDVRNFADKTHADSRIARPSGAVPDRIAPPGGY